MSHINELKIQERLYQRINSSHLFQNNKTEKSPRVSYSKRPLRD